MCVLYTWGCIYACWLGRSPQKKFNPFIQTYFYHYYWGERVADVRIWGGVVKKPFKFNCKQTKGLLFIEYERKKKLLKYDCVFIRSIIYCKVAVDEILWLFHYTYNVFCTLCMGEILIFLGISSCSKILSSLFCSNNS